MTETPTDLELVAYIDGELSEEERARVELAVAQDERVASRVAALTGAPFGMRKAFAPLLAEAPVDKMLAMLGDVPASLEPKSARSVRRMSGEGRRWMIAAALALVVLGGMGDHLAFSPRLTEEVQTSGHWRDIVASYVRLYTPATFANVSDDTGLQTRQLSAVGRAVGLHLDPQIVAYSGLTFKQAQLLQYDRVPIAELNYVDPQYGPMSLCIMPSQAPAAGPEAETRRGLNVSYWNDGHRAFMVIGAQPAPYLHDVARHLDATMASISVDPTSHNNGTTL